MNENVEKFLERCVGCVTVHYHFKVPTSFEKSTRLDITAEPFYLIYLLAVLLVKISNFACINKLLGCTNESNKKCCQTLMSFRLQLCCYSLSCRNGNRVIIDVCSRQFGNIAFVIGPKQNGDRIRRSRLSTIFA